MYSSLYSLKVFERGIREDCEPRCVCTTFTEDGAHHYCCDCIDDEILDRCRSKNCDAVCTNDGDETFECCACPKESDNDGGCFPAKSTIILATGKIVKMSQLQIGHKVQIGRYRH